MKKGKFVAICLLSLVVISAIFVAPSIITGSTKFLIVLSGSMDPLMRVGDVLVISHVAPEDVDAGDIIAFKDPSGRENVIITHRAVEVIEEEHEDETNNNTSSFSLSFKTKGDACEDPDQFVVPDEDIVGKAVFLIPFLGYLFHYARETVVFVALVIIPAGLIIADEFRKVIQYSNPVLACRARRKEREKKKKKRKSITFVSYKRLATILFISIAIFSAFSLPSFADSGHLNIKSGTLKLVNQDILSGVFIFNSTVLIQHENKNISTSQNYLVLPPKNSTEVMLNEDSSREHDFERTSIVISKAPYIMPVFWIVIMAKVNPYLPSIVSSILPSTSLTLALFPIWLRRRIKYRRHTLFKRLRKKLLIAKL